MIVMHNHHSLEKTFRPQTHFFVTQTRKRADKFFVDEWRTKKILVSEKERKSFYEIHQEEDERRIKGIQDESILISFSCSQSCLFYHFFPFFSINVSQNSPNTDNKTEKVMREQITNPFQLSVTHTFDSSHHLLWSRNERRILMNSMKESLSSSSLFCWSFGMSDEDHVCVSDDDTLNSVKVQECECLVRLHETIRLLKGEKMWFPS